MYVAEISPELMISNTFLCYWNKNTEQKLWTKIIKIIKWNSAKKFLSISSKRNFPTR